MTYSAHSALGVAAIRHNLIVIALNMTEPMIEQALAVGGDGLLPQCNSPFLTMVQAGCVEYMRATGCIPLLHAVT